MASSLVAIPVPPPFSCFTSSAVVDTFYELARGNGIITFGRCQKRLSTSGKGGRYTLAASWGARASDSSKSKAKFGRGDKGPKVGGPLTKSLNGSLEGKRTDFCLFRREEPVSRPMRGDDGSLL